MANDILVKYSGLIRDCLDGKLVLRLGDDQPLVEMMLFGAMLNSNRHIWSLTVVMGDHLCEANGSAVRNQNQAVSLLFHTLTRLKTPLCAIRVEGVVVRPTRSAIREYLHVNPRFEQLDLDRSSAHLDHEHAEETSATVNIYVGKTMHYNYCDLLCDFGSRPLHLEFWATEVHDDLALCLKGNRSIKSLTLSLSHGLHSLGLLQAMLTMRELRVVRVHLDAPETFRTDGAVRGSETSGCRQNVRDVTDVVKALCGVLRGLPKLVHFHLTMDFSETLDYLSVLAPALRRMKKITLIDRYNGYIEGEEAIYRDALAGNTTLEELVVKSRRYSTWKTLLVHIVPTIPNLRLLAWGPSEYELDVDLGRQFLNCIKSLSRLGRSDLTCADATIDGEMRRELQRNYLNQTGLLSRTTLAFYPPVFERFLNKGISSCAFNLMRERCDVLVKPTQRTRKRKRDETLR